jgi:hypothetical protein
MTLRVGEIFLHPPSAFAALMIALLAYRDISIDDIRRG